MSQLAKEAPTWSVPEFTINDRLALAREEAGIAQERMAQMLGCSRRSVVRYEQRGVQVPRSVVLAYHVGCSVDLGWLESNRPGSGSYTPRDLNPEPTDYENGVVDLAFYRLRRVSLLPEEGDAA